MMTNTALHARVIPGEKPRSVDIQINQPVGISFQEKFNKYIFESAVMGFESSVNQACGGKIVLECPDQIEMMQRRAYTRVTVPECMNVKVLFWHRGYTDDTSEVPIENYWQGKLVDLSAGGSQIEVDLEKGPNFRVGQLIGLQFTPMSFEKPILLEGHIRHIAETSDGSKMYLGIEFLGLEASAQGREKLHQLTGVVAEYEKLATETGVITAEKS